MINTDETHSPGATQRFLEKNVAAVWGYNDGPAMLQRGARTGDIIFYLLRASFCWSCASAPRLRIR
jgi:hypothetical protein